MNFFPSYKNRVYGLDVFRAIAIILVVHGHGKFMLEGTFLEKFPWIPLIDGVDLFFVLSGFLIGKILLQTIHENDYRLDMPTIGTFWKRRWFRTLPNYYFILIVNILLVKYEIINGRFEQFNYKFFLFLQNFAAPSYGFFWESWSLSIEEWFYIFLPLCLLILLKIMPNKKGILSAIAVLIVLPLVYRISQANQEVNPFWWDVTFRKVVLMRLDTIIYGVLAAFVKFYHSAFWQRAAIPACILGIVIIVATELLPKSSNDFFTKTFYFNCTSIGAMLLLPFADSVKHFNSFFGKVMTHISLISYSMYLINLALVASVITKNFPVTDPVDGFIKYPLYWIIVIIGSTLLYFGFEKPILSLRDRKIF